MPNRRALLLLLATATAPIGLQSCQAPEVTLTPMMSVTRLDPPEQGKNRIWVEYQDLTAQGDGFEDAIWEGLQDAVEGRGYIVVNLPEEADFVLWATTRVLEHVESEDDFNKTVTLLGAVAGGVATAAVIDSTGGDDTAQLIGGLAAAGLTGMTLAKLTQVKTYVLITDLQLGSRRAKAIDIGEPVSNATVEGATQPVDLSGSSDEAAPENSPANPAEKPFEILQESSTSATNAALVHTTFLAEKEQRLVVTARGSRMNLDDAKELMIPKLIAGLKSQLPRYRGN